MTILRVVVAFLALFEWTDSREKRRSCARRFGDLAGWVMGGLHSDAHTRSDESHAGY